MMMMLSIVTPQVARTSKHLDSSQIINTVGCLWSYLLSSTVFFTKSLDHVPYKSPFIFQHRPFNRDIIFQ